MNAATRILVLLCLVSGPAASIWAMEPQPSPDLIAGIESYNAGRITVAITHLQAAAGRGEAEAMVNLGYIYARGQAGIADPDRALTLYRQAAALGDGEAMNAVGFRLEHDPKPDLAGAVAWYCRAIAKGNPRAMNNLALLAYNGRGVAMDRAEARHLWRQGATGGNLNAQASLGADLAGDSTLALDERRAGFAMLRDAARQGSAYAQELLRRAGNTEAFPAPTITSLTMRLEPRHAVPGTSKLCGQAVS